MDDVAKKQQIFPPICTKKTLIANEAVFLTTSQVKETLIPDL